MSEQSIIEKVVERSVTQTSGQSEEVAEEVGNCLHKLASIGCYTLAVGFAVLAMGALWTWVYNPSEFVGKVVIGSATGIMGVVALWLLLIKKW